MRKLYTHGYMNVDAEPMTFAQVTELAKQLGIPDFKVLELDKYKQLAKKYKEPANAIIWIPGEQNSPLGHYVSCFREPDGTLNYQDSFGGGERGIRNCWQISIDILLCSHGIHD